MGDKLWGPLDEEGKKKKSIFNLADQNKEALREAAGKPSKAGSKKGKLLLVSAGGLVAALVLGGVTLTILTQTDNERPDRSKVPTVANPVASKKDWWDDDKNLLPIKTSDIPDFQLDEGAGLSEDAGNLPAGLDSYVKSTWDGAPGEGVTNLTLPGEDIGFTSDPKDAVNPDGTLNPLFTYWTPEIFKAQSQLQVSKLLNPYYGNWGELQFASANAAKTFNPDSLGDTFSADFRKEVKKANGDPGKMASLVPLYADWNANDYNMGGQLLDNGKVGFRWVGVITGKVNTEWKYDPQTLNFRVKATYPITYTAWTQDRARVSKSGTLTVNYVADQAGMNEPSAMRVVVDSGTVNVK